jgi:hypothetical protein
MRHLSRSVTWNDEAFHFERLESRVPLGDTPLWAVSRGGEFIGTMSCSTEVSTKDFDVRCLRWLSELLENRPSRGFAR